MQTRPEPDIPGRPARVASLAVVALAVLAVAATPAGPVAFAQETPAGAAASPDAPSKSRGPKRYRGTRPLVVDRQGQARMPTVQEVQKLVDDLTALTKRTADRMREESLATQGTAVDLESGFAGVMLARPADGGTLETRCVFTFDEGASFLGLVEDDR